MAQSTDKSVIIKKIIPILKKEYPGAKTALNFSNPLEILVATILSAQCTDKQVNKIIPTLFQKYKTAGDYADCRLEELEEYIRSTGFYKNKAKNIKACCQALVSQFNGEIPRKMEQLVMLPGIGRKTANVILGSAFGISEGICVDTHVARLSGRIGLSDHKDPVKIERDLMALTPGKEWNNLAHLLIHHGRKICTARKPLCPQCVVRKMCRYYKSICLVQVDVKTL